MGLAEEYRSKSVQASIQVTDQHAIIIIIGVLIEYNTFCRKNKAFFHKIYIFNIYF